MKITIEGARLTPKWDTLEELVREVLNQPGYFIRIARPDNGVDYRSPGVYNVEFIPSRGDAVQITLDVRR